MIIPELQIGELVFKYPIVQGGMGVRISSFPLPPTVANAGGVGTITTIGLGDPNISATDFVRISQEALIEEIRQCRNLTDKPLAVNVMGALSNARDLIETSVASGIKMIVYGAGIPKDLPEIVPDPSVNLVPIISSAGLARLILKLWKKRYDRAPDAFIVEGPLAGGHLGFNQEQLDQPEIFSLENILREVLEVIRPYEQELSRKIPIIAAGGIYTGADIAYMLSIGAAGVQLGTRFVATHECPAAPEFKQAYLDAEKKDIIIVHSPVGMLGRAIVSPFLAKVQADIVPKKCNYRCIHSCDILHARFCIAEALLNAKSGKLDNGLVFAGANAYRVKKIVSVQELMDELVEGIKASPLTLLVPN